VLKLLWSETAERNIERILDHIAVDNRTAAADIKQRVDEVIDMALRQPYMFRAGRVPGTREIVAHPNYIVIYRVLIDHIEIVRVVHAAQKYP
jgi:toxin ParE1/3/4